VGKPGVKVKDRVLIHKNTSEDEKKETVKLYDEKKKIAKGAKERKEVKRASKEKEGGGNSLLAGGKRKKRKGEGRMQEIEDAADLSLKKLKTSRGRCLGFIRGRRGKTCTGTSGKI